jgi:hypothetical protein
MLTPTPGSANASPQKTLTPANAPANALANTHTPSRREGGVSEGESKSTPKARAEAGKARARAEPPKNQNAFQFNHLTSEIGLANALFAKTGRDLFKGLTTTADRKAAARIAIVMNRLEAEFGSAYQALYGEPLPVRARIKHMGT